MNSYKKVTVIGGFAGRAGSTIFTHALDKDGTTWAIPDRGYKEGDVVEEWYSDEGHKWTAVRITLNGKIIYDTKDIFISRYRK